LHDRNKVKMLKPGLIIGKFLKSQNFQKNVCINGKIKRKKKRLNKAQKNGKK